MQINVFERIERKFETEIASATLACDTLCESLPLQPFVLQPLELLYDEEGIEHCVQTDKQFYALRFTVKKEGVYFLDVVFKDGKTYRERFDAVGFSDNGYIRVSKKDARYFEYSNGSPFFPIGINLAFPRRIPVSNKKEFGISGDIAFMGMRQYERWFKRCAQNGVNMARVWVGHEYFSPDTTDANIFEYAQFSKIDKLLELAKKYNIKLKLTLEQFRCFRYDTDNKDNVSRHFNKRLFLNGKRCESIGQWLSEREWKDAWLNKVREFAKRYAGDTTVFAVELWNEMNCLGDINEWNREMLPAVKAMFPDHLVVNSLGSLDNKYSLANYLSFPWECADFKQMHRYLDQGAIFDDTKNDTVEVIQCGLKRIDKQDMPLLVAETGAVNNNHSGEFKYYSCDDRGIIFIDCVYTPVFLCCAGCGNIWHWDERYVESKNLYKYYKPLADMISDIDFANENFKSTDLSDNDAYLFILQGKTVNLGFIRNKSDSWKNVLRDLNEPKPLEKFETDLPCKKIVAYPIWKGDTTKIYPENGCLTFANVLYGTIFKYNN